MKRQRIWFYFLKELQVGTKTEIEGRDELTDAFIREVAERTENCFIISYSGGDKEVWSDSDEDNSPLNSDLMENQFPILSVCSINIAKYGLLLC